MTRSIAVDRARWMTSPVTAAFLSLALLVALVAIPARVGGVGTAGKAGTPPASNPLSTPGGSTSALDPRIASLATRHPRQAIEAIVQFKSGVSAERARWDVSRFSARVIADLPIINALALKLTAERARWLAANPDVHAVSLNAVVRTEGGPKSGPRHGHTGNAPGPSAPALENTYDQTLGVVPGWMTGDTGAGVGVAVIDTGIDGNLPDFQGAAGGGSRVVETAVTNPAATDASDGYGHGTDVAGIIAGDSMYRASASGYYIGVAPQANLISIKASDNQGNATVLDVIYGLQFVLDHQSDYNIRVVNLSLDSETPQSYTTDPLDAAVEAAWLHGITVVAAAGNRGNETGAVQYAPANDPYVITVGAVDENGTSNPADDFITGWSSQGTTQDGFQKPDLYAPGAHIVSVLAPNSYFAAVCAACQVDGGAYIRTSGTSMAAPMISGLVADLLQVHPSWTPDQIKGALTSPSLSTNPTIQEVDGQRLVGLQTPPQADTGLTPNQLIDPTTGGIDYTRSTWSRSTWSTATGSLAAGFARSSWSCSCAAATATSTAPSGSDDVQSSRSTWSRSTWSVHFDPTPTIG